MSLVSSAWVRHRLPRALHPVAWWLWALGIMTAASLTTNPLIEGLLLAVTVFVVVARRDDGPWGRSFRLYAVLAAVVLVVRVAYRVVFGGGDGDTVVLRLPEVPLPSFVAGIRLFGPVSLESLLAGAYDGLRLATIIVAVGAANSLASPRRLLQNLPAALYEVGTVLVIAVTVLPQLAEAVTRVTRARRLRTTAVPSRWRARLHVVRGLVVPVLADALDGAVSLAASMDARGFGRVGSGSRRHGTGAALAALGSVTALTLFAYDLVAASLPVLHGPLGIPLRLRDLAGLLGLALAVVSLRLSGRGVRRTRYRPERWRMAEVVTVVCGVVPVLAAALVGQGSSDLLHPAVLPSPEVPVLPAAMLVAALVALLPAVLTPRVVLGEVAA